jgi:dephospho-CoA kinase
MASGKTTVLWEFARLGFPTLDTDAVVHRLYFEPEIQQKIMKKFSTLDKKAIAEHVFSHPTERQWIERLLHPHVWAEIQKWRSSFVRDPPMCFVEVPLLFEAGWAKRFDAVILVKAPSSASEKRASAKGLTPGQLRARQFTQWPDEKKEKAADYVIDNSKNISTLHLRIIDILKDLA